MRDRMTIRSIRTKLILGIVALLLLSTGALAGFTLDRVETALREEIVATQAARSETHAFALQDLVEEVRGRANEVASATAYETPFDERRRGEDGLIPTDEATEKRRVLRERVLPHPLIADALVLDTDGGLVFAEPAERQATLGEEAAEPALREHLRVLVALAANARTSLVTQGLAAGEWTTTVPLLRSDGAMYGALAVRGRPLDDAPADLLPPVQEPTDRYVLDAHGRLVTGPEPYDRGDDLTDPLGEALEQGGDVAIVRLDGTRQLATSTQVAGTPWTVVLTTDTAVAFAPIDIVRRDAFVITGLALLAGVVVAVFLARNIAEPVRRIQAAARRVTEGEYGTQVRVSTRDELSDLAGAFNAMSARMQEDRQALVAHRDSLERTIEERTAALVEKNAELETFVYAVSHDLKTPLVSLDWLMEELEEDLEGVELSPDGRRAVERIHINIEGMGRLVGDLLELSRIGKGKLGQQIVPLGPLVDRILSEQRAHRADAEVTIHRDPPGLTTLVGDRTYFKQLFGNLIGNAIKYADQEDGHITIRAEPMGDAETAARWRFEVMDNGPGVAEAYRDQIFQLFARAPDPLGRAIEGTGVGLAIARKIVRTYGGELRVDDAPDGGARFWFTLPSRYVAPEADGDDHGPSADAPPHKERGDPR